MQKISTVTSSDVYPLPVNVIDIVMKRRPTSKEVLHLHTQRDVIFNLMNRLNARVMMHFAENISTCKLENLMEKK